MRKPNIESGRSMLEMIAVLIIIGLLTLGGLTGYNYLVQRYRRQESVKEVAELVMGVRTAALTRKHSEGVTIAAREIVQGPQMDGKGEVIKLPEGENSFVVVTNLTGGAFAVNLQVEKGTCQAILETLKNEDITMFLPSDKPVTNGTIARAAESWAEGSRTQEIMGVKYNVKETEEDKKLVDSGKGAELRSQIMAACAGDKGLGRAAWVFDCSKGSSSYGYLYDLFCSGCPVGTMRDVNGKCCSYASEDRCGNLCSCPQGTVCDAGEQKCVVCTTDPKGVYKGKTGQAAGDQMCVDVYNAFERHVCKQRGHSCVECLDDHDCTSSVGPKNPHPERRFCTVDNHCVECNTNYGPARTTTVIPCPASKPVCNNGVCEVCPEPQIWVDGECKCPGDLVKNDEGECVVCIDDASEYGTDKGCNRGVFLGKPICSDEEGTNTFGFGGTRNSGTTCYECVTDDNCAHNSTKKYCDKNHVCIACDGAWDPVNKVCRFCQDDKSGDFYDKGRCAQTGDLGQVKRLCKPDNSNENGSGLFGEACYVCRNNNYAENNDIKDDGCPSNNKLCNAAAGSYGNECKYCQNDRSGDTKDSGCDTDGLPLCVAAANAFGTSCAKCVNDQDGNTRDTGCPASEPMCGAAKGEYGTTCSNCPAGKVWSDVAQDCVVCYDSVEGKGPDANCGSGTWAGKNICAVGENTGHGKAGNACAVCIDDKTGATDDSGCGEGTWAGKPICAVGENTGHGKTANTCAVCIDDKTGTTEDSGCGGNGTWAHKPICAAGENTGKGKTANSCVECLVNADCPSAKPFCETKDGAYKCVTCREASEARQHNPLRTHYVHAFGQDGCYVCVDNKTGDQQDSGCSASTPVCNSGTNDGKGKGGNSCQAGCTGKGKCLDADNKCIAVSSYDDIERGENGKCKCLAVVRTQTVSDQENSSTVGDWDKTCSRRQSSRKRVYEIPVNFYCERYMQVDGTADDFVSSSTPSGIGTTSPAVKDKTWRSAHNNTITPKYSSGTIKKGTAKLVVQDRWLREVGYKGTFFFTKTQKGSVGGAVTKLKATAKWADGHDRNNPIGGWVNKDGEKGCDGGSSDGGSSGGKTGSTCFYASGDASWAHNCGYPSGRVHSTHCFTRAWPASNTPKASCSISGDKHTVTVKNGRCNADFYEGKNCR